MVRWGKLDALYTEIAEDVSFSHLRKGNNRLVPGEGDGNPYVMIIGEAPGATEALRGRPFVGAAGRVLRQLMYYVGLNSYDDHAEKNCWVTNVVKYRPTINSTKNRTPTPQEIKDFRPYLRREWRYIGSPQIIITIGAVPLTAILGRKLSIHMRAGKQFDNYNSERTPQIITVWPMYHTAYGLRNEAIRGDIEHHWKRLGEWLDNHPRLPRW